MTLAADLAATALELLEEFGEAVTLTRPSGSPSTYDPATGVATPVAPATYTGTGYVYDYAQRDVDGSLVRAGDQRLLLATDGMVMPRTGDTVTVGGVTFHVVQGGRHGVNGSAVVFTAQIRGVA